MLFLAPGLLGALGGRELTLELGLGGRVVRGRRESRIPRAPGHHERDHEERNREEREAG